MQYSKRDMLQNHAVVCSLTIWISFSRSCSILCDEGNDTADKTFAILVQLWDEELGKPMRRFLDTPVRNIGTVDNLSSYIDTCLDKTNMPWSSMVGFESDSTKVMVGKYN